MVGPLIQLDTDAPTQSIWASALAGKTVAVIGLGPLSGPAAVRLLSELGANVIVNDARADDGVRQAVDRLRDEKSVRLVDAVLGGHPDSIADRADVIVVSPGVPYDLPMLKTARSQGVPTIGELELAYRVSRAPFVAITGTKGKSSTATMTGRILDAETPGRVCLAGNIGVPLCEEVRRLGPSDVIVAEVSSFQLESIVAFRPRIAVVLNVTPDHLDRHGTMEAYVRSKRRIIENQRPSDVLIVNADDPQASAFADGAVALTLRISLQRVDLDGAFIQGEDLMWRHSDCEHVAATTAHVRVPGRHNIANALAAIAIGESLGVSETSVRAGLQTFTGLPHALEAVAERDGVRYVDDSKATNVAAVLAALQATAAKSGRAVLIMGGVDKGNDYTELEPSVLRRVKHLVLLGPNVDRLREVFGGRVPTSFAASMGQAVARCRQVASPGDVVLLSPGHASFDLYTDWKERGDAFQRAVRSLE